ncbi:DUF6538 domain-containing protein [Devosia sp. ZB163]|uniref:DUF6538 domain-containing protein n=1 Tax=Devosia sp. ZB163 TaxID=3025938 RepID=UPI003FCC5B48
MTRRGPVFWFRKAIPSDLTACLGCSDIRRSQRTGDRRWQGEGRGCCFAWSRMRLRCCDAPGWARTSGSPSRTSLTL